MVGGVTYRAQAELRRVWSGAPWQLGGVLVEGRWWPAAPGIEPPSVRLIESGNVTLIKLPAFLAPSDRAAVGVALEVARVAGYESARARDWSWDRWYRIELPEMPELDAPPDLWDLQLSAAYRAAKTLEERLEMAGIDPSPLGPPALADERASPRQHER